MTDNTCPLCGIEFQTATITKGVGGWRVCAKHYAAVKRVKYDSRCQECMESIPAGSLAVLANIAEHRTDRAIWVVLHARQRCSGAQTFQVEEDTPTGAWSELYLIPGAPVEVIKAAYKALACKYHPDHPGGSTSKMQALNAAIEELKK